MPKSLKICHVITRMIIGGAQENTLFTIIGQIRNGHDVTLLTGPTEGPEGKLLAAFNYPEKNKINIVTLNSLKREINPIHDLASYYQMIKFFKQEKFDIVHTHSSKAGIIGRLAAKKAEIKNIIHTIHGQPFNDYQNKWKNLFYILAEKYAAKKSDKILAVANAMIDQSLKNKIGKKELYTVVYSGMDLQPYLNAKRDNDLLTKLNIKKDNFVIGTVARLFPLKGYEDFIEAAFTLTKKYSNLKFLLVGDGILQKSLKEKILTLNIEENFIFAGLINPSEVYKYISIMDILVHLSLREGLPRSAVQGLASGKPVVAYNLDGTPEVVINGITGYTVNPGDTESVIDKISQLIEDDNLRNKMGENGRKTVIHNFNWETMVSCIESEYKNLVKKQKSV